jgi:hypothetical protein
MQSSNSIAARATAAVGRQSLLPLVLGGRCIRSVAKSAKYCGNCIIVGKHVVIDKHKARGETLDSILGSLELDNSRFEGDLIVLDYTRGKREFPLSGNIDT